ncbi:hypothetical protein ANCCAN_02465 [Ancylostoma caninum]|uniref:Uncharacterized protein n=1 Tax=Ancylostoma caninum TaxID=29170 RepID=A0A368H3Y1_ANCCA|nr:hypothetical protein ANCCAN_02465 [Ancylostoma caninum]
MSLLGQINSLLSYLPDVPIPKKKSSPVTAVIPRNSSPHCADMSSIIRLAGLSGAIGVAVGAYGAHGVAVGAYGAHVIRDDEKVDARRKKAFEVGSRYHLIHTLALLAAPNARYPWVTSAVFLSRFYSLVV